MIDSFVYDGIASCITIYEKNVFVKVGPRIGVVDTPFTEEVMPRFQAKNMTKLKV